VRIFWESPLLPCSGDCSPFTLFAETCFQQGSCL